jgi:hypothetical protein
VVYAKVMLQKGAHNCVSAVLIIISIEIEQSAFILSRVQIWNVYVLMNILRSNFPLVNIPRLLGGGHRELKAKRIWSVEGRREGGCHSLREAIEGGRMPFVEGGRMLFVETLSVKGGHHSSREGRTCSSRVGDAVCQGREDTIHQGKEEPSVKGGRMPFVKGGRRLFIESGGTIVEGKEAAVHRGRRPFINLRVGQYGGNNEILHLETQSLVKLEFQWT